MIVLYDCFVLNQNINLVIIIILVSFKTTVASARIEQCILARRYQLVVNRNLGLCGNV